MLKSAIGKVIKGQSLSEKEMMTVMDDIMEGKATASQIGGLLVALRMKGETIEEISGCAKVMRRKASSVEIDAAYAIDTCGTGGDGSHTFNVSTGAALIAAAAGVTVVKHGNRSVSSKCGSADVLEHLGVNIGLTPSAVQKCVKALNIGFIFAPNFHQAMSHAAEPRRELGIRTIFNILGPLTNPAGVKGQVLGVFAEELTDLMAEVLKTLGVQRAMVVHGLDGLDEITITTKTKVSELKDGQITNYMIDPRDYGLPMGDRKDLEGGSPRQNAEILRGLFQGAKGVKRNMLVLNAGAAIYVGKQAGTLEEGICLAEEMIDGGLAVEKLNQLILLSQGKSL
ncbi:anthranilate phosphoribosyltransferase [Geosporobacter subterraneus DSM 17957]|uniref:Anthranilate phosphoribosyltransferase n=1 Tax=Geosporobacter subterraneus DSM 17957 TaxID=1121919 RepID=A0A1M6L4N9_9FIRM|nr:anthranilate phosphoribosyltransferase [Geosporobacter subterraneus]SHJ66143.1 anthranilate phosphoribosyltransferase [Geosporobacter subterraneus DSM 17957]